MHRMHHNAYFLSQRENCISRPMTKNYTIFFGKNEKNPESFLWYGGGVKLHFALSQAKLSQIFSKNIFLLKKILNFFCGKGGKSHFPLNHKKLSQKKLVLEFLTLFLGGWEIIRNVHNSLFKVSAQLHFAEILMLITESVQTFWLTYWLTLADIRSGSLYLSLTYSGATGLTLNLTLAYLGDPGWPRVSQDDLWTTKDDPWATPSDPWVTQDYPRATPGDLCLNPGWSLGDQGWPLDDQGWPLGESWWPLGNPRWPLGDSWWSLDDPGLPLTVSYRGGGY